MKKKAKKMIEIKIIKIIKKNLNKIEKKLK